MPKLDIPRNYSSKEICKCILDNVPFAADRYVLASSKVIFSIILIAVFILPQLFFTYFCHHQTFFPIV
jgi:hypothetical protein